MTYLGQRWDQHDKLLCSPWGKQKYLAPSDCSEPSKHIDENVNIDGINVNSFTVWKSAWQKNVNVLLETESPGHITFNSWEDICQRLKEKLGSAADLWNLKNSKYLLANSSIYFLYKTKKKWNLKVFYNLWLERCLSGFAEDMAVNRYL